MSASVPASTTTSGGAVATKTVYVTVTASASRSHSTAILLPILISVRATDIQNCASTHDTLDTD
jgi:hypothetical protein